MRNIFLAAIMILAAVPAGAQPLGDPSAQQKTMQETSRVLRQAQAAARTEAARQAADRAADNGQLGRLASEAKSKLSGGSGEDARQLIDAVDQRLAPALRSAEPEGRAIIAQSAVAPATRAPDPDAPKGGAPAQAPTGRKSPEGGKGKGAAAPPSVIHILSEGAVYLDSAQALTIFTDDVVLDHPQFHMTSDKLEVYFIKESDQKATPDKAAAEKNVQGKKTDEPNAAPKALPVDSQAPQSEDAKLKQAIATGKKVVIRKTDENGEPQIGICRHATYIGESGDIILREMPQVQRGNNVIVARGPSTYMVLKQNGELKVYGPADTRIEQKPDLAGKPKAANPASPAAVPSGPPALTPKKTEKK